MQHFLPKMLHLVFERASLILPPAMGEIRVNDEYLTWQEFWKRGEPLVVLAVASLMLPISYGVLWKKKWIRPFLVCFPVIQLLPFGIVGLLFEQPETLRDFDNFKSTKDLLWSVFHLSVWVALATWYLYYKETVVDFFTGDQTQPDSETAKN